MAIYGCTTIKECNVLLKPYNLKVMKSRSFRNTWAIMSARGTPQLYALIPKDQSWAVRYAFDLAHGRITPTYGTYTVKKGV
jgi:hypothetical protein